MRSIISVYEVEVMNMHEVVTPFLVICDTQLELFNVSNCNKGYIYI